MKSKFESKNEFFKDNLILFFNGKVLVTWTPIYLFFITKDKDTLEKYDVPSTKEEATEIIKDLSLICLK